VRRAIGPPGDPPIANPSTWLLRIGWRKTGGDLSVCDSPRMPC
jgi:hypothetical protein